MTSLVVLLAVLNADAAAANPAPDRVPLHLHPTLQDMLARNNELRKSRGLKAQRMSARLTRAAQDHAWYMARTGNFSHNANAGFLGRAHRFGYKGNVRENIAMGHRTVRIVFDGWRNSGGHWASIISDTPDAGFGYAISKNGTAYWVALYGYPDEPPAATGGG